MRAVCSARASWRPIQYSSWAIRASISPPLLLLLLLLLARSTRRRRAGRASRGGDQRRSAAELRRRAGRRRSSSTHVSFEPPPCEELTIIEPSRSATRVRPPGTIWMSSPNTANGRRSTWRGASVPSGHAVGHGREPHELLGDPALRAARRIAVGLARDLLVARGRADEHALAARLARRLDDQLGRAARARLALLGVGQQVGRDVVEDRLLAEVVADHLRHVVVDRLVVGDARADRVDDRHRAGAVGAHQARARRAASRAGTRAGR